MDFFNIKTFTKIYSRQFISTIKIEKDFEIKDFNDWGRMTQQNLPFQNFLCQELDEKRNR